MHYSQEVPKILNEAERRVKAAQILGVLLSHIKKNPKVIKCLDIGCSSGVVTYELSKVFGRVVGIDVDKNALIYAKKKYKNSNLDFYMENGEKTHFENSDFDLVILNQVYEFVENPEKLLKEVYRILKNDGICFFAARNKYALLEAQYKLPFLSWIPQKYADVIVRLLKKGSKFMGKYKNYKELKILCKDFIIHDYTKKILLNPKKYGFFSLIKYKYIMRYIPLNLIYSLIPNYIWILEKK